MDCVRSYLREKLDLLRSNDRDYVTAVCVEDLGSFLTLSGLYLNIKPKYLLYSILQFIFYFAFLFLTIIILTFSMYYCYIDSKLEILTQNFFCAMMTSVSLFMLVWSNLKRQVLTEFYTILYKNNKYDHIGGLNVSKLKKESRAVRNNIYTFVLYYYFFIFSLLLIIGPITELFSRNSSLEGTFNTMMPFTFVLPFDFSKGLSYFVVLVYQTSAFVITLILVGTSALGCLVFNQRIWENLTLLNYLIKNIEHMTVNRFNKKFPHLVNSAQSYRGELFDECFYDSLIQVVKRHQQVLKLLSCFQSYSTWPLLLFLLGGPVLIATASYAVLSTSDSISFKVTGIIVNIMITLTIGIICWYGNEISSLGEELQDNVYGIPWMKRNRKTRRVIYTILISVKKEVSILSSVTNVKMNLETFTDILKASNSYIMYLLTTQTDDKT